MFPSEAAGVKLLLHRVSDTRKKDNYLAHSFHITLPSHSKALYDFGPIKKKASRTGRIPRAVNFTRTFPVSIVVSNDSVKEENL